jgi:hypothetical protein
MFPIVHHTYPPLHVVTTSDVHASPRLGTMMTRFTKLEVARTAPETGSFSPQTFIFPLLLIISWWPNICLGYLCPYSRISAVAETDLFCQDLISHSGGQVYYHLRYMIHTKEFYLPLEAINERELHSPGLLRFSVQRYI